MRAIKDRPKDGLTVGLRTKDYLSFLASTKQEARHTNNPREGERHQGHPLHRPGGIVPQ